MACHAVHPARFRFDLENELFAPRTRLVHGDYALVPVNSSHRMHSDRPLSHYYADDNALDTRCALRPHHMIAADAALIDRDGPYSYSARCRNHPHICDDAEYFDLPDPNWRFSYKYPLQCMEPGGARWSPDQIYAYNRDVLRHNNQIARRRAAGVPGEYMMLYPIMDPLGRFPPGFDRPLPIQDFFGMDGKQHSHHFPSQYPPHLPDPPSFPSSPRYCCLTVTVTFLH